MDVNMSSWFRGVQLTPGYDIFTIACDDCGSNFDDYYGVVINNTHNITFLCDGRVIGYELKYDGIMYSYTRDIPGVRGTFGESLYIQ